MGAVFISYRRGDTEGQARTLSIELGELIGKDSVFMDVDSIALGRDFRQVLQERILACDIVLVLIGPNWLEAKDAAGNRRLENPGDFVRQEIASALKRGIVVTPVLLQGASMPGPDRLPPDLQDLVYRNGFELSHTRWVSDVKEMFKRLGLMAKTGAYEMSLGTHTPSPFDRRFAAAAMAAKRLAAAATASSTTTASTGAATGANAPGNAAAIVTPAVAPAVCPAVAPAACPAVAPAACPAGDSMSSAPRRKQMRRAIIAVAGVSILAVLALAGYISMRKKTTHTTVPTTTLYASTVPATTVPATTVPAATVPATAVPATTVPANIVPAATVPATAVPATTVPANIVPETAVPETTVPDVLKMQRVDAEAKMDSENLKAVVVTEWNPDAEQQSVIETKPAAGTKVNPGDTVTLHVSGPGGWFFFGQQVELEVGKTVVMKKRGNLHVDEDKNSKTLGSVGAGKSARILAVGSYGWAKVVVDD